AILISLLLPALNKARESARRTVCLSNLRTLSTAYIMYAQANRGRLCSSDTFPLTQDRTCWVTDGNNLDSLRNGTLWPYVKSEGVFLCPNDLIHYVRTYSINSFLNSYWPGYPEHARTLSQIRHPTETFLFCEEYDERGFNMD